MHEKHIASRFNESVERRSLLEFHNIQRSHSNHAEYNELTIHIYDDFQF